MASILVLGAGVMGSALAIPVRANGHAVTLVGSPLDDDIVAAVTRDGHHPTLDVRLPDGVRAVRGVDLGPDALAGADAVIVAVSSAGIDWATSTLCAASGDLGIVGLVTKGLVAAPEGPCRTYAATVPEALAAAGIRHAGFVGIGGPCIAREIALGVPTSTIYAARDRAVAEALGRLLDTPAYRVHLDDDVVGLEACAALKNFLAIGVSATIAAHRIERDGTSASAKNPTAALFTRAVGEMAALVEWLGGSVSTAHGLAGAGDLHVTVGGGRNSRLGLLLGEGMTVEAALAGPLAGQTVEGRDTGRVLGPALRRAQGSGALPALPLCEALLAAIEDGAPLRFDYGLLGDVTRR